MLKILYVPIALLIMLLAYTIYSGDSHPTPKKEWIGSNNVIIYSKAGCIYCIRAKKLLEANNIPYIDIDISGDIEKFKVLEVETNQSTVPFIFIHGTFIGGYSHLVEIEKSKQLYQMLEK